MSKPARKSQNWRSAVLELLADAGRSQSDVAKAMYVTRVVVNRYLNGGEYQRTPTAKNVKRINKAVSDVIGCPEAAVFLNILALRDFGDQRYTELWGDAHAACVDAVIGLELYMRDGYGLAIVEAIEGWSGERAFAFACDLAEAYHRRIVASLRGHVTRETELDEIVRVCKRRGLDITRWLADDVPSKALLREVRFTQELSAALTEATADSYLRRVLEARMLARFFEFVTADRQELNPHPSRDIRVHLLADHWKKIAQARQKELKT